METLYMENQGFQGDDAGMKAGDRNRMEERDMVSPLPENDRKKTVNMGERKVTLEAKYLSKEQKRNEAIKKCKHTATDLLEHDKESITNMDKLLEDKEFSNALFSLFDQDARTILDQDDWFEMLKINTSGPRFAHISVERRQDIVAMIENAAGIICGGDKTITQEDFRKIINSRGIRENLFRLADSDGSGNLNLDEVIDFLVILSKPRYTENFTHDQIKHLEDVFKSQLTTGKEHLTLEEFKKIMPSKNNFFVERCFKIFDIDGDGTISMTEFLDKMYQFAGQQSDADKILFLFKIYDIDGDGMLQLEELQLIMEEALRENGLRLPANDVQDLTFALYEEALGPDDADTGEISIDQLKDALAKHDGVLENLTISLNHWLVPKKPRPKETWWQQKKKSFWRSFSWTHIKKNPQLFAFMSGLFVINIILFIARAVYFKDFQNLNGTAPNIFYVFSRANGRTLLFNCTMIMVVVLRYTITMLRNLGVGKVLPLDNNIYIHKIIGILIVVQAWWHTIMHLINFGINVQPDPVKFVTQNDVAGYWKVEDLNYQIPPNGTERWAYHDWILTMRPGMFGIIGGIANPSGVALIIILTIMAICSMPFVRRSGRFEVFYFTHLLYYAFFTLLIFHAPEFWKWVIAPLVIFVLEKLYRTLASFLGVGKSYIVEATVLASRVTKLKIKRPDGFKYSPGDWAFIRVPTIANSEWHPFTISSAPENREHVTFHIRGVGQWTNKLYDYVEAKKKRQGIESRRQSMKTPRTSKKNNENGTTNKNQVELTFSDAKPIDDRIDPKDMMEVNFDGPFGAPATNIFRAEHAVLVATGIGVTPFSSILQSIMYRYHSSKRECPRCQFRWLTDLGDAMQNLKKVDFIWINRDQKSFEWFLNLLSMIEADQETDADYVCENGVCTITEPGKPAAGGQVAGKFLDLHLYFTQALQRSDVKAVGMHLAMDLLHKKSGGKDILTGLKSKTNAGRPNWDKIFQKLQAARKGQITVFYCGNPVVASILRGKCEQFGFDFRKEVF